MAPKQHHSTMKSFSLPLMAGLLAVCFALRPAAAWATENEGLIQPADTSSPQATLRSFIDSCNGLYDLIQQDRFFDRTSPQHRSLGLRILDCLDTSELPEYARHQRTAEAAACLKEILDRVNLPGYEEIAADIQKAGGVDKVSRWRIPGTRITLSRVDEGPRKHEYLFSLGTVERAVNYYKDMAALPYRETGLKVSPGFYEWYLSAPGRPSVALLVNWLPDWARARKLGLAIWQWIGLLITVPLAGLLMAAAYRLDRKLAGRWRGTSAFRYCLTILFPIIAMLIPLGFLRMAEDFLAIRGTPLYVVSFCAGLTALLAGIVVIFGASNRIAEIIIASPRIQPQGLDAQLIRIVSKLASLVACVVVFLEGGQYLGIPLTTLLASAGIGGLAVALAAQDTLKSLFGTITLMADKPFRVGERIVIDKYDGVVEDIGLRSTRIRLLTGNQVTVPNDQLARADIENVGRRRYIRRNAHIKIPLDAPLEKVEKAVEVIRGLLQGHEGMAAEYPPRVFFSEFNPDSFNVRITYWFHPPNFWEFLAFSEKLNVGICKAFGQHGIPFSLPTRLTYTSIESEPQPLELQVVHQDVPETQL